MSSTQFTSEKLVNKGKTGIITPDKDGYYDLVVGGLNCFNSVGQYYSLDKEVEKLFLDSSKFMRKVNNQILCGENGHPEYVKGMTDDDYLRRMYYIKENNIVCHFGKIWLDMDYGKNNPEFKNPSLVAIMAKVIPYGEKKLVLQDALDNRLQNLCFSIRSLTNVYYHRGVKVKQLVDIITFDLVSEGGISIATKYDSPSLESVMDDIVLTKERLIKVYNDTPDLISTESSKSNILDTINNFEIMQKKSKVTIPIYNKW